MTKLDMQTTVPFFAIVASIPVLFGGMLWLTSINAKAEQALRETSKIEDIQKAVTRLEIKFGTLPENK